MGLEVQVALELPNDLLGLIRKLETQNRIAQFIHKYKRTPKRTPKRIKTVWLR